MLSPHPGLPGPLPKHTPLLIDAMRAHGASVLSEPWGRASGEEALWAKLPRLLRDVIRIRRVLTASHPDVMVLKTSHEWLSMGRDLALLLGTRRLCRRIVIQFHGGRSDRLVGAGHRAFKAASWLLFRAADGVLVLSSEEARESAQFYPRGRFRTVSNPFVPCAEDNELQADGVLPRQEEVSGRVDGGRREEAPRVPTLLFASRLIAEKGIFDVLEALAVLRGRAECRLVVAGGGPALGDVKNRVDHLRLGDIVQLQGQLQRDEMDAAYRSADVFVLPTYWFEGFPTAITEAMSAGLPIVATRTRGITDHLVDGINALFVPAHSPARVADALERLLGDPDLRSRMAQANREKVKQFEPMSVAQHYLRTLTELVGPAARNGR